MNVLGLDPGFKNLGYVVMGLGMGMGKDGPTQRIIRAGVFVTDKSTKKLNVLATEDNLRRAREIGRELSNLIQECTIQLICAESMSFPRNASAAAKVAMTWGAIATLSHVHELAIIQASPQQIKKAVCGKKDASKEEIEDAVLAKFPEMELLLEHGLVPASNRNHAYDALAAILTGMESDIFRAVRSARYL